MRPKGVAFNPQLGWGSATLALQSYDIIALRLQVIFHRRLISDTFACTDSYSYFNEVVGSRREARRAGK
jgi:hypothetical protein